MFRKIAGRVNDRFLWIYSAIVCGLPITAQAGSGSRISLPSANEGFLQKIVTFMQDIIDFVGGAGALFIAFMSGAGALILWTFAPKQSAALGFIMRCCVAAIGMFNLGLFIAWLQK